VKIVVGSDLLERLWMLLVDGQ